MKVKLSFKNACLFFGMVILTVAGSEWAYNIGANQPLEYASYAVLLSSIVLEFIMDRKISHKRQTVGTFVLVTLLFSIGLMMQDLTPYRLFVLLMTMLAISVPALLSESYINSFARLEMASNAVLIGVIFSFLLSLTSGVKLIGRGNEGILGMTFQFTGGIRYKNYFSADMVIVFIGHYLSNRYIKKTYGHNLVMLTAAILLALANSRGGIIMLFVFLICMHLDVIRQFVKRQRMLLVFMGLLLGTLGGIFLFQNYALSSANYTLRFQGLLNYINNRNMDLHKWLFGIASQLYDQNLDYVLQFRSIFGFDGTMEFALLDILVKNGILGLSGFMIIFVRNIKMALQANNWEYKTACIAIMVMLLVSSLVETYIQSIHSPMGIYCYLAMGGFAGLCRNAETSQS